MLGHPTARWLLRREGARFKLDKVIDAAVANGVALEINSQPHRLDLCDSHARLARDRGAKLAINSDAHEIRRARLYALGYPDGAPGVADERRRDQYAAVETVQGRAEEKSIARD